MVLMKLLKVTITKDRSMHTYIHRHDLLPQLYNSKLQVFQHSCQHMHAHAYAHTHTNTYTKRLKRLQASLKQQQNKLVLTERHNVYQGEPKLTCHNN